MSSIMRARSAVTGWGERGEVIGGSSRAEGCWTFNARDRMPRSSPLTAHPLTASAKNAPAPTPLSRESGFVLGSSSAVRSLSPDRPKSAPSSRRPATRWTSIDCPKSNGEVGWEPILGSSTYPRANASRAGLSVRGIARRHCSRSVQSGDQLAANPELDCGALEIIANRLATSAGMRVEERFHDGFEGAAIFRPAEAVAFGGIIDIGHGDAASLHGGHDLPGFGGLDSHVVGALADQQRPHNAVGAIERRTLLQEPQPRLGGVIAHPHLP